VLVAGRSTRRDSVMAGSRSIVMGVPTTAAARRGAITRVSRVCTGRRTSRLSSFLRKREAPFVVSASRSEVYRTMNGDFLFRLTAGPFLSSPQKGAKKV
jgi:hypothetical protein